VGEQIEQEAGEEARARQGVDALHARAPSWWPRGLDGVIEPPGCSMLGAGSEGLSLSPLSCAILTPWREIPI
jgi:hypothetical protein